MIGADKLWGSGLETAGNGMKIGIIDDGARREPQVLRPDRASSYPPGFPKGQTQFTTPEGDRPAHVRAGLAGLREFADDALRPDSESFHATHVGGIAAGDHGTLAGNIRLSGVAPNAYLGNYKALTIPTPNFGLDGNAAEIAAAIEAAVSDGMNVINLSLGEPEVEPKRDIVVHAIEGAARAGVVPVVAAGNDFDEFGYGSVSSPATRRRDHRRGGDDDGRDRDFSSAGPTPVSLQLKPDVSAPGVGDPLVAADQPGRPVGPARRARAWRRRRSPAAPRC